MFRKAGWWWLALIIGALALALRAPFAAQRFRLMPDAIAYLNIARHIAAGDGFVSSLKLNYFDPSPVTHCALYDWPPLYPLVAGLMTATGVSETGLQLANALICSIAAVMVFLIADRLFERATALLAGLFCALSLSLFRASLTAMSDPLALALALSSVLSALTAGERRRMWLVAGVLAGLAYLARYPNGILFPVLCGYAVVSIRCRGAAAVCALGFLAAALPPHLCEWVLYGSPFHSAQMAHYTTTSFQDSSWLYHHGSPARWSFSVEGAWRNTRYLTTNLVRTATGLQLLSIGLVVALAALRRDALARGRGLLALVAALNFAVYALTSSLPAAQGARFLLLSYCLLLPLCAEGFVRLLQIRNAVAKLASVALCIAAMVVYVTGYGSPLHTAFELKALDPRTAREITGRIVPGTAVASNNPWAVWYSTGLPTAALPRDLDPAALREFEKDYSIGAYVVFNTRRGSQTTTSISRDNGRLRIVHLNRAWIATPREQSIIARGVTHDIESALSPRARSATARYTTPMAP